MAAPRPAPGRSRTVRRPQELVGLVGLDAPVLPGGESSTIDRLSRRFGVREPLIAALRAGMIMVVTMRRNAFGRQVAVRQGPLLATSFHPEATTDTRVHALFVAGL